MYIKCTVLLITVKIDVRCFTSVMVTVSFYMIFTCQKAMQYMLVHAKTSNGLFTQNVSVFFSMGFLTVYESVHTER